MTRVARSEAASEAMSARHAQTASKVMGPLTDTPEHRIVFYQLTRKFVDDDREIPEKSVEVMYYTLAVGHHTGIMDCFDEKMSCSVELYQQIVALFPVNSEAHYKLEGVLRSGEIQVDVSHLPILEEPVKDVLDQLDGVAGQCDDAPTQHEDDETRAAQRHWLTDFSAALTSIRRDPAIYLIGRERAS